MNFNKEGNMRNINTEKIEEKKEQYKRARAKKKRIDDFVAKVENEFESFCTDVDDAVSSYWCDMEELIIEKFKEHFPDCSEDDLSFFEYTINNSIACFLNAPWEGCFLSEELTKRLKKHPIFNSDVIEE